MRKSSGSYADRKGKTYRHPLPNAYMSPRERREQYLRFRAQGATVQQARRARDYWWG